MCVITRYNAIRKANKKGDDSLKGRYLACASEPVTVDGVPNEIKILPLGMVHSQKGDFQVDDESVEMIRSHFKERKLDLVIDYEHQTLQDIQAPAGGWIKDIYKGEDVLIAKVEWTQKAAEYLKNKEYRYLSPVVLVRKKDRKAMKLHSVALTNTPAIDGMFPIVNSEDIDDFKEEEDFMELKELITLLGLTETATIEDVRKALTEALKKTSTDGNEVVANSTVLSLLSLNEDARTEDVVASIMALKAGNTDVAAELLELKNQLAEKEADELVNMALKEGKISAAQTEWAKQYALSDKKGFKSFLEKAPVVVNMEKMDLKDAPEKKDSQEVDMEILKNMGISEEDYKNYYKQEEK